MNVALIQGFLLGLAGGLAFAFARPIAHALAECSANLGVLFRKHQVWGTLTTAPDAKLSFENHLHFVRFVAALVLLLGISICFSAS